MNDKNMKTFLTKLSKLDFQNVINCENVNTSYNLFTAIYQNTMIESFPLVTKLCFKQAKHDPWITPDIITKAKIKSKLYKCKQINPSKSNSDKYKQFNNDFNKLKRTAKHTYYNNILETHKNDIKKTWVIINNVLGRKGPPQTPAFMAFGNDKITCKKSIANTFNSFFLDSVSQILKNIPSTDKTFETYLPNPMKNSLFIDFVEPYDIQIAINEFKPKTSSGFDEISCKLLKLSAPYIIKPLVHIINTSFASGIVPDATKVAKVIPIFKGGDPCSASNYRPVSILPAFSKIFEKIMYMKTIKYLNKYNLLYTHQYGFRAKHNTLQPIIHLLDHIAKANSSKTVNYTLALFCDLSKAFDVIDHNILLHKLWNYGIRGTALKWYKSYLSNRTQFTNYCNFNSPRLNILQGVPQGSILGPLLFLIYVNDIGFSQNVNIVSFADDTTMYMTSNSLSNLYAEANENIKDLYAWFSSNKLFLNANKTKYMIFSPPNIKVSTSHLSIEINGNALERVSEETEGKYIKFLGIRMDEHLSWRYHTEYVSSKISRALFSIKQLKYALPTTCLCNLYKALIHLYISNGIQIWGNASQNYLNDIIRLQKRSIRIVDKAKITVTQTLFSNLVMC